MPPRAARSTSKGPGARSASKGRKKALDLDSVPDVAHAIDVAEVLEAIGVNPTRGLREKDIAGLQEKYGLNELPKEDGSSVFELFLQQFDDPLVKILLGAAMISLVSGIMEQKNEGLIEFTVIMVILLLNAGIGVFQEKRAEDAIDALQSYNPEKAKVRRDGKLTEINSSQLVPSDIVEINVGDKVPADIRLISMQSTVLKVEQAALTGESASVNKNPNSLCGEKAELQKKDSIMFSGTDLVYGKCTGVVIKTGSKTEIGKIAKELANKDDEQVSPLKQKLDTFGEQLTTIITVICVLCWAINVFSFGRKGQSIMSSDGTAYTGPTGLFSKAWFYGSLYYFKEAVALAVAAIPEGLPAVVTTCLALGTRRMAKRNALIRHLPAVETLGCTSVICSDKTGTLTTNMMSVQKVLCYGKDKKSFMELDVDGNSFEPSGRAYLGDDDVYAEDHEVLYQMSKVMSLCNGASINKTGEGRWEKIGEATEAALKVLVEKLDNWEEPRSSKESLTPASDRFEDEFGKPEVTLEFSRDRKSMGVMVSDPSVAGGKKTPSKGKGAAKYTLLVKGAPEAVLDRCSKAMLQDGTVIKMDEVMRKAIMNKVENEYNSDQEALRCLAHAFKDDVDITDKRLSDPSKFSEIESDLTFVGVAGILDPPRIEVKEAIVKCKSAGIRVIVITGDNQKTAEAICRMIGVFGMKENLKGKSYTGAEFHAMNETQRINAVCKASLFSRTEPIHKQEIVKCLQVPAPRGPGEVAAMTGDGVNDAPALKAADIGVAMGSGTAVAQAASKMVLADDNFTTIVAAVEEGRGIYNNTKAFIRYLISSNIGEVVCIFLAVLLGIPEVLVPVTLLWVNLVTDGLPATALSFNPPETDIMTKLPRKRDEQLLSGWILVRYFVVGAYVGLACIGGFLYWMMYFETGPMMTMTQLRGHLDCPVGSKFQNGYDCAVMESLTPKTVSLSILVVVEMFNALNAISENESLLQMPPWVNPFLIFAIIFSMMQHVAILSFSYFQTIFQVAELSSAEWWIVFVASFPVILLDEVLKIYSRHLEARDAELTKKNQ